MNEGFASAGLTAGQLNAIVKRLGGKRGAIKFLQGKNTVSEPIRNWREEDGVIKLGFISDGTTGPEWIKWFEGSGFRLGRCAVDLLNSPDFKPTSGVITNIAIFRGTSFKRKDRIMEKIRTFAAERKLEAPNAEVACLICKAFSDEEIEAMGLLWIVVMHRPIKDSCEIDSILGVRRDNGGLCLDACSCKADFSWDDKGGFAFVVPQASSKT